MTAERSTLTACMTPEESLIKAIIHAERTGLPGPEKENIALGIARKLLRAEKSGGLIMSLISLPFVPWYLRIAIRSLILILNECLGSNWIKELDKKYPNLK